MTLLLFCPVGSHRPANGSSPRRARPGGDPSLVRASTRSSLGGEVLYGDADAAAVLIVTKAEAAPMFDVGTRLLLTRTARVVPAVVLSVVFRRSVRSTGRTWCRSSKPTGRGGIDHELLRCEAARASGVDPDQVRPGT